MERAELMRVLAEKNIKPFVKWAGGKSWLISELSESLRTDSEVYMELFVGGGSFFLFLLENIEKTNLKRMIINDINTKLISVYEVIRDSVEGLIDGLKEMQDRYNNLSLMEEKEQLFYSIREDFNASNQDLLTTSRDFIFLNKTCFNGLYRENLSGAFNVPFGKRKSVSLYDRDNLLRISERLNLKHGNKNIVEFYSCDFKALESMIAENIFCYIDPPYRPVTRSGFKAYNKGNFNDKNQIELAEFCQKIEQKKGYFVLSNSDPRNLDASDDFFDELYRGFEIKRVFARRNINSDGSGRGKISEILIKNFTQDGVGA